MCATFLATGLRLFPWKFHPEGTHYSEPHWIKAKFTLLVLKDWVTCSIWGLGRWGSLSMDRIPSTRRKTPNPNQACEKDTARLILIMPIAHHKPHKKKSFFCSYWIGHHLDQQGPHLPLCTRAELGSMRLTTSKIRARNNIVIGT